MVLKHVEFFFCYPPVYQLTANPIYYFINLQNRDVLAQ